MICSRGDDSRLFHNNEVRKYNIFVLIRASSLGKTRPQTGVMFRDPEAAEATTQSKSGDVNYELVAPDGTPVFLSFSAPWVSER